MKRNVLFYVLINVLIILLFTNCGVSRGPSDGGNTQPATAEKPTLSWMVLSHPSYPYQEDWFAFQNIAELFDINVEVEPVDDEGYKEKLQLKVATGSLNDIIAQIGRDTAINYGTEDAFVDLSKEMGKLPVFSKWAESNGLLLNTYKTPEGSFYCFPFAGQAAVDQSAFWYRQDILALHNLNPPETYDDLYLVSQKLKEIYPDSNPFAFRNNIGNLSDRMARQWGTGGIVYFNHPADEFRCGYIEDNYKELVAWMAKMYAEGLIPPDFMSLNTPGWEQLIVNDLAFISSDNCLRIDTFNQQMQADTPAFSLKYLTPPKGDVPDGVRKLSEDIDSSGHAVSAINKNKDIAMGVLDKFYAPENFTPLCYGKEGKTFIMVDGRERFIGLDNEFIDIYGVCRIWGLHTPGVVTVIEAYAQVGACGATPECIEAYDRVKNDLLPVDAVINFSGAAVSEVADLNILISSYAKEMIAKFILGTEPLSNWDNYVSEIKKYGCDTLVAYYNDLYKK